MKSEDGDTMQIPGQTAAEHAVTQSRRGRNRCGSLVRLAFAKPANLRPPSRRSGRRLLLQRQYSRRAVGRIAQNLDALPDLEENLGVHSLGNRDRFPVVQFHRDGHGL